MSDWSREDVRWAAAGTAGLVRSLLDDAAPLEIGVQTGPAGAVVVDCGVAVRGSWEAGRRVAELSHAGMMRATLAMADVGGIPLPALTGDSWRPPLSVGDLQVSFALDEVDAAIRISGPVRAAIDKRVRRAGAAVRGVCPWGVAVVETTRLPDLATVRALARRAGIPAEDLTLVLVPTNSAAGVAQLAGRLNECVLFTLERSLGLDSRFVTSLVGVVPLAPFGGTGTPRVTEDDMIHYAGRVAMGVEAPSTWDLQAIAERLVFRSSPLYGRLFSELLAEAGGVLEAVPGLTDLNKVACVTIVDRSTGRLAAAGGLDERVLVAALRPARGCDGS